MSQVHNVPFPAQNLLTHMAGDKKAEGGTLTFILVHGIGKAYVARKVGDEDVLDFLILDGATAPETTSVKA